MKWLRRILFGSITTILPLAVAAAKVLLAREIAERDNWTDSQKAVAAEMTDRALEVLAGEIADRFE